MPAIEPGKIFSVPLYAGGFAFGYVTVYEKAIGTLCNIVDLVAETNKVPDGLADLPLALEALLIGGAEFRKNKTIEHLQWKFTKERMPGDVTPDAAYFIMQSRPAWKLVDLTNKHPDRPATQAEIDRYPNLASFFPPFTTKLVEKAVRHLDIDARLIGDERPEGAALN